LCMTTISRSQLKGVQWLDLPPDKARGFLDLVATTDGILHFYFGARCPRKMISPAVWA